MEKHLESLGERIVQVARLAVAMHLEQAATAGGPRQMGLSLGQRVMIGGADPRKIGRESKDRE